MKAMVFRGSYFYKRDVSPIGKDPKLQVVTDVEFTILEWVGQLHLSANASKIEVG